MVTITYPDRPGFREHASGLLVPEEQSRAREVWTKDEARLLERAMKLLKGRGIEVFLRCERSACHGRPIERIRGADGGLVFRCEHADRVLMRAF